MIDRRTLLRVAVAAPLGAATGGCAGGLRLQTAVVWSDEELAQFRRVLQGYHRPVAVLSAGDNIDAFLRARQRTGARPDVAVLSRPGLVIEYAKRGWLSPLDGDLAGRFDPAWTDLLTYQGELFGIWVKAAHKSLGWHLRSVLGPPPRTWPDLVATVRSLAPASRRTGLAPLAIGAADGWVLTDWFENVLAAIAPSGFYRALARAETGWTDEPVREALSLLAELWNIPGAFPGGGERALLTQFAESVIQVATGAAAMTFEADFVASFAAGYRDPGTEKLSSFRFPAVSDVSPLVVGGDAAVILRGPAGANQTGAHELVRWLTRPDSFLPWIADAGYLSPLADVPLDHYPPGQSRRLAAEVATADDLQFDLSDQLPGLFTGSDGVGSWRILQDFFTGVTTAGANLDGVVEQTMRQLATAAREAARQDGGGL